MNDFANDDLGESLAWLQGDADEGDDEGSGDSLAWLSESGDSGATRGMEEDRQGKLVPLRITDLFDGSLELNFLD